ncbi:hypothetical protein L2E82_20582 [Cichorium intybus]|uniref:Uncharacterized protein n=1 Tax=Cichorium intybus TaxID=13427 RepID=A0ACB9DU40_CICIN|nr:hypothetical protein L2E82_20582 [Cichorium intybus]
MRQSWVVNPNSTMVEAVVVVSGAVRFCRPFGMKAPKKADRAARFGTKGHALTFLSSAGYSNVLNQVCSVFGFRSFFYVLETLLHHMLLFQFVAGLTMEPASDALKQILQVCTGAVDPTKGKDLIRG